MQIHSLLRAAVCALLLGFGTACAPNQPAPLPRVVTQEADVIVPLPAVLEAPQQWSGRRITLVAPVQSDGGGRVLSSASPSAHGPKASIWLAEPLPEDVRRNLRQGTGLLKLHGVLSPPGAYGAEQQFPYQFTASRAATLVTERTTITNLALNPGALDQILLRLTGTLLARPDAALLVEKVSEGGVPLGSAKQLKVPHSAIDQTLLESFRSAGDVRWGTVEIVGWWQNGALTPLIITSTDRSSAMHPPAVPSATAEPQRTSNP